MNKKKVSYLNYVLVLSIIIILGLLIFGAYYYISSSTYNPVLKNTKNGITVESTLYDQNGKPLSGTAQTVVNGRSGLFYLSIKLKVSNTGNTILSNISVSDIHPNDLSLAMQNQIPLVTSLNVGQSNIVILDSANDCSEDTQCASNEKCVGTPKKCLIDISNFIGNYSFGVTISANYKDAYGVEKSISTPISLPITFEQDNVIFRTDAVAGAYGASGKQIVVDVDGNGNLEVFTYSNSGSSAFYPVNFLAYTPQNNLVWICTTGDTSSICVSTATGLDKSNFIASVTRSKYLTGGTLTTSKVATEPYKSFNCAGSSPCQEMYSSIIVPNQATCSDSTKNQDETDIDCGGSVCSSCVLNKACLTNSDCNSDNCSANLCSDVSSGSGNVIFRTNAQTIPNTGQEPINYKGSSIWVALDTNNDGILEPLGYNTYKSDNMVNLCYNDQTLNYNSPEEFRLDWDSSPYGDLKILKDNCHYYVKFRLNYGSSSNAITSNIPCCGSTCGTCCEKYSDGTSNC